MAGGATTRRKASYIQAYSFYETNKVEPFVIRGETVDEKEHSIIVCALRLVISSAFLSLFYIFLFSFFR